MTTSLDLTGKVPTWNIADRVRKARDFGGMKQEELAAVIGMSRGGLAKIEQGKSEPRRTTLISIAFATGVSLLWLETGKTPGRDNPGGGGECAIRDLNPEPTDLGLVAC